MFAINNFNGIIEQERCINEQHIVILLFVKPSDKGASDIINQFNFIHHSSRRYCSIYAIGYSEDSFSLDYPDVKKINAVNNSDWYYSDKCFIEFIDYLQSRLSWVYSGEPEVIVL